MPTVSTNITTVNTDLNLLHIHDLNLLHIHGGPGVHQNLHIGEALDPRLDRMWDVVYFLVGLRLLLIVWQRFAIFHKILHICMRHICA
jgi:hypothetical protein